LKYNDIPADSLRIRVRRSDNPSMPLEEQPVYSVEASLTRPDEFEIRLKDSIVFVKPVAGKDVRLLIRELAPGHSMLSRLANKAVDGSIDLEIKFFTGGCLEMELVEIGVDEYAENSVRRIINKEISSQALYKFLEDRCCFIRGNEMFFFIIAGHAIDDDLKEKPEEKSEEKPAEDDVKAPESVPESSAPKPEARRENSFCIIGDTIRFIATETEISEGKSIYLSTRLTLNKNKSDLALRLVKGKLQFVDWTKTGQIQLRVKAQMDNLIKDKGSYLNKWDEFGNLEGDLMLDHARDIHVMHYCDMQIRRDGNISVRISQAKDSAFKALEAEGVESVEKVDELPDYLTNMNLTFAEFVNGIEQQKQERRLHYIVSDYDKDSKTLVIYDPEAKKLNVETKGLPKSGMLILSLAGEIAQIKRRIKARRKILEGRSANPQIGLLIEEKGEIAPVRKLPKVEPLTGFVRSKIFKNQPTPRQEEAIEAALTTPDILLIQGPPGTGKTTVIAAILERLNEMADKRQKDIKGQVLLTGFQHDAVENMIDGKSLNGIPIPKFGKRSGADKDDFDDFNRYLIKWCSETAEELGEKDKNINKVTEEKEIKNLSLQYFRAPTRSLAVNLAKRIASLDLSVIGQELSRRAENTAQRLSQEETISAESNTLLKAVRRLRVRPESFADDGPDQAADALEDLKDKINKNEQALLDQASSWCDNNKEPPFLKDLAELKKRLLIRFTPVAEYRVEKQRDEILALADEAIKRIQEAGFSAKDKKAAALAEFRAELENPYGMIDALSDYSYAFAATCQQSVGKLMQAQKGIKNDDMEFDVVIVDEAARVSPRDLMIPMAQGKRIILVGDHRQLPHIIEDEVARKMEEGETGEEESKWLKKSMFEYLFAERLKELEQKDSTITRYITLDTQYRMHPILGDFISDNFYKESERFSSGRLESDSGFIHNLLGTDNKPAIWLDVPASKGICEPSGTSKIRSAEAAAIAKQLQAWMNSKEGERLTFGVISFYKAQADLIKEYINKTDKDALDDDEKLRVGTVDSFQGREFDVVFLSMVRILQENWKPNTEDREKQSRKAFGHLCLYNRLNVSMSRQKRLLVVAGDSGSLKNDLARDFIPGLVNFYELCREKGKVLPCP